MAGVFLAVCLMSDGDGHDYLVPNEEVALFESLLKLCTKLDDYEEFERFFSKYRLSGDVNKEYQLYICKS